MFRYFVVMIRNVRRRKGKSVERSFSATVYLCMSSKKYSIFWALPIPFWTMPSQNLVFLPDPDIAKSCYVSSLSQFEQMHQKSINNPSEFWGEIADNFFWKKPIDFENFHRFNFDIRKGPVFTKWLDGATTNISFNLLDRNIQNGNGKKIAFYWWVLRQLWFAAISTLVKLQY